MIAAARPSFARAASAFARRRACVVSARSVAAANASDRPQAFKDAKRDTARFYFGRILPRTLAHKAAIEAGAGTLMAMPDEGFGAY